MALDLDYFLKINNASGSTSKKDIQLHNLKSQINDRFADTIDCYTVPVNGVNQDLLIIRTTDNNKKTIKCRPNEDFSVGDIVAWEGSNWLVISKDSGNQVYTSGKMQECNYTLLFQSPTGAILSYPCITSSKSFSNDENKVITLGSNQKSLWCAFDENTATLKVDRRLYVDKKNPPTPYKILGDTDTTSTDGLVYFIVEQDTAQTTNGVLPKDRPDLGICNYREPVVVVEPEPTSYSLTITSSGNFNLGTTRTLTPTLKESDGTVVSDWIVTWTVDYNGMDASNFNITYVGNQCKVAILDDNYDLIDGVLKLTCTYNVYMVTGSYSGTITA